MSRNRKLPLPPAFQEQINLVRAIGHLEPFLALLSRFGIGGDHLKTIVADLKDSKQQATKLAKLIEEFLNPMAIHRAAKSHYFPPF